MPEGDFQDELAVFRLGIDCSETGDERPSPVDKVPRPDMFVKDDMLRSGFQYGVPSTPVYLVASLSMTVPRSQCRLETMSSISAHATFQSATEAGGAR